MSIKVRYDNDINLVKQKICLDKDLNLVKVEVMNKQDDVKMRFTILEYDLKKTYDEDYFKLSNDYDNNDENNIKQNDNEENKINQDNNQQTSKIEDIVYPMYVPVNTYLSNQDKVSLDKGERVIMTFAGETPFLLVQETAKINDITDFVNGDPYLISDTIGAVNDYSVSWINNGVEYNVLSDAMSTDQLIAVAESISSVSIGK